MDKALREVDKAIDSYNSPHLGDLSEIQQATLMFIRDFIAQHGYSPTVREISGGLDKGDTTAHFHVQQLVKLGYVEHTPNIARSIRIIVHE